MSEVRSLLPALHGTTCSTPTCLLNRLIVSCHLTAGMAGSPNGHTCALHHPGGMPHCEHYDALLVDKPLSSEAHAPAHAHAHGHAHAHAHAHAHPHDHPHVHPHDHPHTQTQPQHTHTHTCTHTQLDTHTHTHTHTQLDTQPEPQQPPIAPHNHLHAHPHHDPYPPAPSSDHVHLPEHTCVHDDVGDHTVPGPPVSPDLVEAMLAAPEGGWSAALGPKWDAISLAVQDIYQRKTTEQMLDLRFLKKRVHSLFMSNQRGLLRALEFEARSWVGKCRRNLLQMLRSASQPPRDFVASRSHEITNYIIARFRGAKMVPKP